MPSSSYASLPGWLQIVLILGAVAVALVGIFALFRKAWTAMSLVITRINSLDDLPRFMVTTAATLEAQDKQMTANASTLAAQDLLIEDIHHEVKFNNGSSVKDAIQRVEFGVKGIYARLDSADRDRDNLRHDLEVTRPVPIRKRTTKPKETL
jgi:hypothetical protein